MAEPRSTLNKSVVADEKNVVCLTIGDFTIKPYQHGGFWMENELGEGMQVREELLERALREFWHENF